MEDIRARQSTAWNKAGWKPRMAKLCLQKIEEHKNSGAVENLIEDGTREQRNGKRKRLNGKNLITWKAEWSCIRNI